MKNYRAIISVPVTAKTDDEALDIAVARAHSLMDSDGVVRGHLEFLGEGELGVFRVVEEDPGFRQQVPRQEDL